MRTRARYSRAKRRFGQNFLNDIHVARRIAALAAPADLPVVEIGAGKGLLTRVLAQQARSVIAVEIDPELVSGLSARSLPGVTVVAADFLAFDLAGRDEPIVVGNIPYALTAPIIEKLVRDRARYRHCVLTIQKEYGEKMLALPGGEFYGHTSVSTQYYFSVTRGFSIPARYFTPRPAVSSLVVRLDPRQDPEPLTAVEEAPFFSFVQAVFRYRRKRLGNALRHATGGVPADIAPALLERRPEQVTAAEFIELFRRSTSLISPVCAPDQ